MQPIQLDQFTQTDVRLLELTETELAQAYNIHKSGWLAILSEIQSKTVISVARSPQMAYERLNIFYSEEEESYILPVYHFGTAWTYVGAYNN